MNQSGDESQNGSIETANSESTSEKAPVRLSDLIDLYSRPRRFFSGRLDMGARRFLIPAMWLIGISAQIDRMDTEIIRHELDPARPTWVIIEPLATGPWINFWAFCLGVGIISATFLYFVAGWWYRVRVTWSSVSKDIDKERPRYLYCWSSLAAALPYVLLTIGFTFAYPNYLAAYNSDEMISLTIPIFLFWSVAISYVGVTETYDLTPWKARLWFLVIPAVFYLFVLGLVMFLFALMS